MALIECKECGAQVSDSASACPKCGCPTAAQSSGLPTGTAPVTVPARSRRMKLIKVIVVGVSVVGIALGIVLFLRSREQARQTAEAAAKAESDRVTAESAAKVASVAATQADEARALGVKKAAEEAEARRIEIDAAAKKQAEDLFAKRDEEKRNAERAERESVLADPTPVLETSGFRLFDKGILNSYRQLASVTVLNRTRYSLRGLSGQVEWLSERGKFLGATPFTLAGSLSAGATRTYTTNARTLDSGTIQSSANTVRLKFGPARPVE